MQTDYVILARQPDLALINMKKELVVCEFYCYAGPQWK